MTKLKYTDLRKKSGGSLIANSKGRRPAADARLVGQEEAAAALRLGLSISEGGFNIYVSGRQGFGRATFAEALSNEAVKGRPKPPDLCYVYNFKEPRYPTLLRLPSGIGESLKADMEAFTAALTEEMPEEFGSKGFEEKKHVVVKVFKEKRDKIIKEITDEAKAENYGTKTSATGIYFMPIINGEEMTEEQYDAMPLEEKEVISKKTEVIQDRAQEVMREIREFERVTQKEVAKIEREWAAGVVDRLLAPVFEKFDEPGIHEFLNDVKEDVLANLADFAVIDSEDEEYQRNLSSILSLTGRKEKSEAAAKYHVNVLVSADSAPVIFDENPTYAKLIGEVEYDNDQGSISADYMMIRPGLLHRANGGVLILRAEDVLRSGSLWEALLKSLVTGKVTIEPNKEYTSGQPVAGLKPQSCDIDVKVILVGSAYMYHILKEFDEDFGRLFKINAVFDSEMPYTSKSAGQVSSFAREFSEKLGCEVTADGVLVLLEELSREAASQNKLSAGMAFVADILTEAALLGKNLTGSHIKQTIKAREKRAGLYEEKINELFDQNIIMLDTDGEKTAQINGLAVFDLGDYMFAKPTRITATTYVGKSGVVNIEKEADMSGNIHSKGVQVIIGYLGQKYAQDFPLSLSCRVCFEQSYAEIDGDSASGAELVAILSSLANLPVKQNLSFTGSINQRGEIQAIGGCTQKIEGFFGLCKKRGLTGDQGVIIPKVNIKDLTLRDDVVEAVKKGEFHIYAIEHIDEAVLLLTGTEPGVAADGKYPKNSVHGLVYKKLKRFNKRANSL